MWWKKLLLWFIGGAVLGAIGIALQVSLRTVEFVIAAFVLFRMVEISEGYFGEIEQIERARETEGRGNIR